VLLFIQTFNIYESWQFVQFMKKIQNEVFLLFDMAVNLFSFSVCNCHNPSRSTHTAGPTLEVFRGKCR